MSILDLPYYKTPEGALRLNKSIAAVFLAVAAINTYGSAVDDKRWTHNAPLNSVLLGGYAYAVYRFARFLATPAKRFNITSNPEANALHVRNCHFWDVALTTPVYAVGTSFMMPGYELSIPAQVGVLTVGAVTTGSLIAIIRRDQRKIEQLTAA